MINKINNNDGLELSRLGLGCMRLSMNMTGTPIDKKESIATIHKALDSGINLLNTGDFYGNGDNEELIAESLKAYDRDKAFISLKYGTFHNLPSEGNKVDVGPKNVRKYITASLKRLKMDYVDLYQPARIDIGIPLEDTIGAISDLVKEGLVKHIGLSEVDADILRRAHAIHPISMVELSYSIIDNSIEKDLIPTARELGIKTAAFGIMGFGKLKQNQNDTLMVTLNEIATEKNISISQLAHAWIINKGDDIIPLIGPRNTIQLEDSIQSLHVNLKDSDILRIEESSISSKITGPIMPKMVIKNGVLVR